MLGGRLNECLAQRERGFCGFQQVRAKSVANTRRHLVVSASGGVHFAAVRPHAVDHCRLDGFVNVFAAG